MVTDEEQTVSEWRQETLERENVPRLTAFKIAQRTEVDLHRAVEMARAGCPPELMEEILL
jgi:hypothetical protein